MVVQASDLGEIAPWREAHREAPPLAAHHRAVAVGPVEGTVEPAAPGAAAATRVAERAGLALLRHGPRFPERLRLHHLRARVQEHRERVARAGPVHAGLDRRAWRHAHRPFAAAALAAWQPRHRPHERLAYRERVGFREEALEPLPVLLVLQRERLRAHRLVDVHSQRSTIRGGDAGELRETQVVRSHHDGDERDRHAEPPAARRLLVDEVPVAGTALRVLLLLRRIVERQLHVVKGAELLVREGGDAVPIGGHGELHVAAHEEREQLPEPRVEPVLAGTEVHGADREAIEHGADLLRVEPVRARWVPVAKRAGQVALVGEAEAQREARRGRRTWWGPARSREIVHGPSGQRAAEAWPRAAITE
jgi:hypothetical protein